MSNEIFSNKYCGMVQKEENTKKFTSELLNTF